MATGLRFDRFELDPTSGELRDGARVVRLEPQPARALAYLLARRGEVATRQDLQRELWPADTFVDFDRGLNTCIAQIRTALGETATAPRLLETLPKRGYRLLAPPTETTSSADLVAGTTTEVSEAAPAAAAPNRRPPTAWARPLLAGLVMLVGLLVWRHATAPSVAAPTIAVTLFTDETVAADRGRLAQRLTDTVVERLAATPERWGVIGNAAILRTPRPFQDLRRIATELDADYVLLGQLQETDGKKSALVHLIRTGDQKHLWVNRFALDGATEAAALAELGRGVADAVRERTSG